jgi:pimeloyl-ACP methyl ester carboxylesterase
VSGWIEVAGSGVRLACWDFGGRGRAVLMVHGLAGHSGEWTETAAALGTEFRIIAFDQRGHGRSERRPGDVSRRAFVADVVAVIEELSLAPAVLVGQSMGGGTAFLAAAAHPELVDSLVMIEASPDGPLPELPPHICSWLERWPIPFADETEARTFFLSQGLAPGAWSEGLERREGGLWPAFDNDVLVEGIADLASRDYWSEWRCIRCPTLLVRGERGNIPAGHYEELVAALSRGQSVTIAGAGHDVHLDAPGQLADVVRQFLNGHLVPRPAGEPPRPTEGQCPSGRDHPVAGQGCSRC